MRVVDYAFNRFPTRTVGYLLVCKHVGKLREQYPFVKSIISASSHTRERPWVTAQDRLTIGSLQPST